MKVKNKHYIGTAGWSYKDWVPSFYPKRQTGGFDWLQFYSGYFNCVEVNASYYAYLNPKIVNGWMNKIEDIDDFIFTVKLHQDFTHKRNYSADNIKDVTRNLDILAKAERFGGLLLQFPYSFEYQTVNREYLNELLDVFRGYKPFIEVRNLSWFNQEVFDEFRKMNVPLCTIDQPKFGKVVPFEPIVTADRAYFRFHGRNWEAWKDSVVNHGKEQTYDQQSERYKYLYTPGELVEIQQKIQPVKETVKELFVIMNNHPTGYAVANAFEMIHLLEERSKVRMPDNIVKVFNRLETIAEKVKSDSEI
jgi:uncharacterized protein YecE (DUF72 family)